MLSCTISIDEKAIQKYLGKKISNDDFGDFCKKAVSEKLFEEQFNHPPNKALNPTQTQATRS